MYWKYSEIYYRNLGRTLKKYLYYKKKGGGM